MGSSVAADSVLTVGRSGDEPVSGYRLLERIGFGGAGEVWRAEAPGGLSVALKLIRTAGGLGRRELSNLRILRAIRHPNLLAYFGAWTTDDLLIIGMELADRSLWDRWRELSKQGVAGIPIAELLEALGEVANVIDFLHEPRHQLDGMTGVAILHRDIKPQNIMLLGRGVKVADFGLSTLLVDQGTMNSSHSGLTYSYAAPETFRGQVTNQSDQYSLAVTYCVLRGGRLPFAGPPAVVRLGHMFQPPDLSMLPEPERRIVARALAKEPTARWPDCHQFIAALQSCPAAGSPETIPTVTAEEDGQAPEQHRSAFFLGELAPGTPTVLLDDSGCTSEPSAYQVGSLVPAPLPSPVFDESRASTTTMATTACVRPTTCGLELKSLAWVGIACLLLTGFGAWCIMMSGASLGQLPARLKEPNFAAARDPRGASGPAAPIQSPEPASDLLVPPDPLGPISEASAPPSDFPAVSTNLPGGGAPALLSPIGSTGERTKIRSRLVPHPQGSDAKLGDGASRVIRLTSAWLSAMRIQAGQAIREAREALAAQAASRTTPTETTPPAGAVRAAVRQEKARMSLCLELPEVIEVDAGWSKPVPIVVSRGRATGPITVRFEGLPTGISLSPVAIPARLNRAQACVRAEIGACRAQARIRVTASAGNERAERPISLVVRANPSLAYRVKGHSLLAGGKPSEAVAAFSHALALASPDPIILNNRGLAYALLGQPDAAIADYAEALRLSPRDPVIRCNRGTAYARRGDSLRAQLDFDTAIRLNPGYIPAYRSRALLYARMGEPARAAADLVKADQLERAMSSASKPAAPVFSAVSSSSSEACYRAPTTLDRVGGS